MKIKGIMKKSVMLMVLFVLISAVLLVNSVFAKTYNLSFATATPDMHPITKTMLKPWADRVEEATDGQVKVTMYTGGSLIGAGNALDAVSSGLTDIAWVGLVYFPNQLPLVQALAVQGIDYESNKVASTVDYYFIKKYPEALGEDIEFMYCFSGAVPGGFLTRTPVQTLEDLKGLQFRSDGVAAEGYKALGITPVAMPMAEAYEALSKNVIDGVQAGPEPLVGWKLDEVTDYFIKASFTYNSMTSVVMNKNKFESLPEDIQETIKDVNEKFFKEVASYEFGNVHLDSLEYGVQNGIKVIEITGEEKERWIEKLEPTREAYAEKLNKMGLPGDEAFETIEALCEKYTEEFKEHSQKEQQRLKEIVDKYDAWYEGE